MGAVEDIIVKFSRIANEIGFEYTVVGGIAVFFHGVPRATMDIDCIVKADEGQLSVLAKRMKAAGFFVDLDDLMAMMRGEGPATIEDKGTMMRLDLHSAKDDFAAITLDESIEVEIGSEKVRIASPETTIVSKLHYGSPQDIKDAEGIYGRLRETLDLGKLDRFARMRDVKKELTSLRRRVDRLMANPKKGRKS